METLVLASDQENVIKDKLKEAMRDGRKVGNFNSNTLNHS